jgi:hypothetical protein
MVKPVDVDALLNLLGSIPSANDAEPATSN